MGSREGPYSTGILVLRPCSPLPVDWRGMGCKVGLQEEEELLCCEEGRGLARTEWEQERGIGVSWAQSWQSAEQCFRSSPLCPEGSALKDETFWKLTFVCLKGVTWSPWEGRNSAISNNCCRAGD